jgi:hypothetical protein
MGMMDMAPMPQEMPPQQMPQQAPQQGMMGGQPPQQGGNPSTSHGKYNGIVDADGTNVQIANGVGEFEGKPVYVSDNGAMVVDKGRNLLGHVVDGKFVEATPEYLDQMRKAGFVE